MLYQFLIIDMDVAVNIIMGEAVVEVVAVVEVAIIPRIMIFMVYVKARKIAPTTRS